MTNIRTKKLKCWIVVKFVFDECMRHVERKWVIDGEWTPVAMSRYFDTLEEAKLFFGEGSVNNLTSSYAYIEVEVDLPDYAIAP